MPADQEPSDDSGPTSMSLAATQWLRLASAESFARGRFQRQNARDDPTPRGDRGSTSTRLAQAWLVPLQFLAESLRFV